MPACSFDLRRAGKASSTLMNPATPLPSVFDMQSLAGLKDGLRKDDPKALKAAAQQFEAIFLQMMLKSMRAATPQDGMFESDQTRFYQEMLDAQLSQVMAAQGGTGLAAVIERQLSRTGDGASDYPGGIPLTPPARAYPFEGAPPARLLPDAGQTAPPLPLDGSPVRPAVTGAAGAGGGQPADFAATMWPHAVAAGNATGIPPQFLVAHAALESGWGRSEPRYADGSPSHNLFGIKAGGQWQGAVVEASTTEYVNGVAERRVERFRAYGSYAEAFQDYARLLSQSPRYAEVLGSRDAAGFARGLQRAGYATDPAYAAKLERIINGGTLRQALIG
ncbi:MAG: flagellar assembly peptidoglycan hydrolase FlgJ [Pseudomonadota bacterium]